MKWLGVLIIALGVLFFARGIRDWGKPPIQDQRWYYGTSRQLTDVGSGLIGVALGVWIYRSGLWPK